MHPQLLAVCRRSFKDWQLDAKHGDRKAAAGKLYISYEAVVPPRAWNLH
jgi:hypothetical protein